MNTKTVLLVIVALFVLFIFMGLLKSMNIYEGNENQTPNDGSSSQDNSTVANITNVTKKSLKG